MRAVYDFCDMMRPFPYICLQKKCDGRDETLPSHYIHSAYGTSVIVTLESYCNGAIWVAPIGAPTPKPRAL